MNAFACIFDVTPECRVLDLDFEEVERPEDRKPGLDQSDELLIEEDEILRVDLARALAESGGQRPAAPLDRDWQESLFLKPMANFTFVLTDLNDPNYFAGGLCVFADKFH